jgi:hypothetical protein
MPFLWIEVDDEPSKNSMRSYIERNAIAMLSNSARPGDESIDPASAQWLGNRSASEKVRRSGLWNRQHVQGHYDPGLLGLLRQLAGRVQ